MNAHKPIRSIHIHLAALLTFAALGLAFPAPASAAGYTFTNIADDSGSFNNFGLFPSINNAGTVVFASTLDLGGSGIFTGNGVSTSTIADTSGPFSSFGNVPSINDSAAVAFTANFDLGGSAILTSTGGPTTTIADTSGSFTSFGDAPSINSSGTVAFNAQIGPPENFESGIFTGNGGSLTTIATEDDPVDFLSQPSINDAATVAYQRLSDIFFGATFASSGGPATLIAESDDDPISTFGYGDGPSINNSATVAFYAILDDSSEGIFTGNGGPISTIADTSGSFLGFSEPDININGDLAFQAFVNNYDTVGIYTGSDPVADKVIQTGDSLFGSTVDQVVFFRGLNDTGDIAFYYQLFNSVTGIAVAYANSLADFNADGFVDGADFSFFLGQWGAPGGFGDADFNSDNTVDGADFSFFLGEWNPPPPGLAFIPEPTTVALLALTGLTLLRRSSRHSAAEPDSREAGLASSPSF